MLVAAWPGMFKTIFPRLLTPIFLVVTLGSALPLAAGELVSLDMTPRLIQGLTHTASVSLDPAVRKITVQLRHADDVSAGALQLTLQDGLGKPMTVELRAVPRTDTYIGTLPVMSGARDHAGLSAAQQSFFGIELSIPLSQGRTETLRFKGD